MPIAVTIFIVFSAVVGDPRKLALSEKLVNPIFSFGIWKKIRRINIKLITICTIIFEIFLFLKIYSSISKTSLKILLTLSPESIDSNGSFRNR